MAAPTLGLVLRNWSPSRKLATLVLLVALVAIVAGALLSDRDPSQSADARTATTATTAESATDGSTTIPPGAADAASDTASAGSAPGAASLPLEATVTNTSGLHAGDEVRIAVAADKGSLIYAVEARLCKAGTVIRNDADMRPTVTGQCAARPLSPGASGYLQEPAAAPFKEMVAAFKVGVGTDSFPLDDGGTAEVTCGPGHPCVLAVKYQIPNGFGFRTYSLTFA